MFCRNCGTDIGDSRFCPKCGTDSKNPTHNSKSKETGTDPKESENIATEFTDRVKSTFENITGGSNKDVQFKLKDLWSNVMQKHSTEESEDLLISGTSKTTPSPAEMADKWTRPWLYSRVFAVLATTFALLLICTWIFQNLLSIPGLIFIGAMMMPFTLLVLFWETNIPRNISIFDLVKMFFVGGVSSLVFTLAIFSFVPTGKLNIVWAIIVGIVEEIGKLVAIAIFIKKYNSKYILNGILIGAAIGAGFAVFESSGYALLYGSNLGDVLQNIILRGLLAAGGHIVWAAMSGAAIMFAKGGDEFRMHIFKSVDFWKLFPVPIILHAMWDMPFSIIPVLVLLTVIAWVFILALIRSGMAEASRVSAKAKQKIETGSKPEEQNVVE
ncbi:MAG: PrsW family intramembrane metalloprotease [Eubacteriales bacterium]|nr:PrsW family intramembrane metalloprotease [Eubacteriales bacterium]